MPYTLTFKAGSPPQWIDVVLRSPSRGEGVYGLTGSNKPSAYYVRMAADGTLTQQQITLTDNTNWKEADPVNKPGLYYLQVPAAALAAGSPFVMVAVVKPNVILPRYTRITLTGVDPYDSVRMGMSALPNASASAAGGLLTRGTGAGQISPSGGGVPLSPSYQDSLIAAILQENLDNYNPGANNWVAKALKTTLSYTDPWSFQVPGSYQNGTAGRLIGEILPYLKGRMQAFHSDAIVVTPFMSPDGSITLVAGDSYTASNGRAITWSNTNWPNLSGYSVTLVVFRAGKTHVYDVSVNQENSVVWEPDSTQTRQLGGHVWSYAVRARDNNGVTQTLVMKRNAIDVVVLPEPPSP